MAGQQPTPTPAAQQPAATSPDDLLARGDALFTEGLFDRALARYKEAQSLAPSDLRVQNRLAQTHLRLGNRGAGLAALGSIFAAKPELKDNADLVELRRQLEALPAAVATATGKAPQPSVPPSAPAVPESGVAPSPGGKAAPAEPLLAQRTADVAISARTASLELSKLQVATDDSARATALDRAWDALRPALVELDIDNAEAWRAAAVIAIGREDRDLAAIAYEGIIRLQPDAASDNGLLTLLAGLQQLGAKDRLTQVRQERAAALEWFPRARAGDKDAIVALATAHAKGLGVSTDVGAARKLLSVLPQAERDRAASAVETFAAPDRRNPGQIQRVQSDSLVIETMWIPAGVFTMGSPASEAQRDNDEGPQHQVRISKGFWMMTTEVQQGQWQAVMGSTKNPNPSSFKSGPTYPVERVSWYDAVEFANMLTEAVAKKNPQMNLKPYYTIAVSKRGENDQLEEAEVRINAEARGYRLPTEAEWEYACRAGTTGPFHFGQTISTNQANYDGNLVYGAGDKGEYRQRTTPTAFFGAAGRNAFGLYDMRGNVEEWCWDWYDAEWYKGGDRTDPIGPQTGSYRVLRGGSWNIIPRSLRSAFRIRFRPAARNDGVGFRLCLDSE